jgi:hypothetical protein
MATNRERFFHLHDIPLDESLSLEDIARVSGFPIRALREVFNRGVGAWKTNPESVRIKGTFQKDPDMKKFPRSARLTPENWGYGRVYSFVMMEPGTFYGADRDIARAIGFLPE